MVRCPGSRVRKEIVSYRNYFVTKYKWYQLYKRPLNINKIPSNHHYGKWQCAKFTAKSDIEYTPVTMATRSYTRN